MRQKINQRGMSTAAIVMTIATLAVAGLIGYVVLRSPQTPSAPAPLSGTPASPAAAQPRNSSQAAPAGIAAAPAAAYSGTRLAGDTVPLLDFTAADYAAALQSNKLIVLYFYANWCPICREEFPKMQTAFNQLTGDQVIGFRVNFNDNETDDAERTLAREHGIAYQHTKVFVRNQQQALKSPETWETARYLTEIQNALNR